MSRSHPFGTLDSRIYTIFTVMIFTAIIIMQLISFRFTINTVRRSTLDNNRVMLRQLVAQIDSYVSGMEPLVNAVIGDRDIQALFAADGAAAGSPGYDETVRLVGERLGNYSRTREDISEIMVMGLKGQIISSDLDARINPWTDWREKEWYTGALDAFDRTVVSSSYVQNLIRDRYPWVVSLSRTILLEEDRSVLGILLVDLKFMRINELCRSLSVGKRGYNFILDREGNYVFHPTQQLVYSSIKEEPIEGIMAMLDDSEEDSFQDEDRYFMVETSEVTGWHVVSVIYDNDIVTDWQYVQGLYALVGLVLFLIVGFATNRITSGITKPVKKLQGIMRSVDTGDFRLVGNIRATDEIRELAREYDIMVTRIRELMDANTREQELKRKSDLKALQAQINPHFLYNTLDSIIWMGEMGQSDKVVQMTSALSKLFRISISKGRELIPIRDEIEHVRSYLTIQEMRYRDKFTYRIDVDPSLYELITLKITLQPLVENAIYHGIKEADYPGVITITGIREEDAVILEVRDNGCGMDSTQLADLIRGLETPPEERSVRSRQGMGVHNVHERIRIYFGPEYGLTCESAPGEGTVIRVRIPVADQEVTF